MSKEAKLELDGKTYTLPTVVGTEGEKAVDISSLRASTRLHHAGRRLRQHRLLHQQDHVH